MSGKEREEGDGKLLDERRHFDELSTWKQEIIIFDTRLLRKEAAARLACHGVGSDTDGIQTGHRHIITRK